ncbi:MAG: alpha/beta hydrolase [Clostridia bacterium]|nr:alpha/beta hydrolase [Clostridia bacterium]
MKEIKVLSSNPGLENLCEIKPDVEFTCPDGLSQKMQVIMPWRLGENDTRRFPLIVFIQGSAWTKPNQCYEIPQLSEYARMGYVVATVTHRSAFEAKAPAFLVDVKSAIRYLRAHADEFLIDPERVCAWGTSSGGNTSLLVGVTGGMEEFDVGDNLDQSSSVKCVIDCFGPTDLVKMVTKQYAPKPGEPERKPQGPNLFEALAGQPLSREDLSTLEPLARISPVNYVEPGKSFPPFLILHGDADPVVLYEDSLEMYEKLSDCGYDAEMIRITGAPHEGSFWSVALHDEIKAWLKAHL